MRPPRQSLLSWKNTEGQPRFTKLHLTESRNLLGLMSKDVTSFCPPQRIPFTIFYYYCLYKWINNHAKSICLPPFGTIF